MRNVQFRETVVLASVFVVLAGGMPPSRAAGQPPKIAPEKKKPAQTEADSEALSGKELTRKWAELVARREKILKAVNRLESDFTAAKGIEEQTKIQARFEPLQKEFLSEINPGLNRHAAAIHRQDPADPVAAQIVIGELLPQERGKTAPDANYTEIVGILKGLTRTDAETKAVLENMVRIMIQEWRNAEIAPLVDKLAAPKDAGSRIVALAAMVHLSLSEFDKAAALINRAVKTGEVSPDAAAFEKTCDDYVEFWKTEQSLRAAEAKANDLPRVLFKTTKGEIVLELFENEAPNTVANFISLVEAKKYNGVKFHRVIPGFMAQGGDPNTLDDDPANDGQGGPGYAIPCECYSENARMHFQGSLSMAHSGKDSGGSQFYINHAPTPHLNWVKGKAGGSNHTVFGRVLDGLDVALALRTGDKIISASVIRKRDHEYKPKTITQKPRR